MKHFILLLLLLPVISNSQNYILSLKILTPDSSPITDTTRGYTVQIKFAETYLNEFLNIKYDSKYNDWDFFYSGKYIGGTYIINIVNAVSDTMNIVFNTSEPSKLRKYYTNLFIDNIVFRPGTFYIEYPSTLADWNSLIAREFLPVHFGRFYDITEYQTWVESNLYNVIERDSLVGVWQDNKVVGSGWSNTYLFFKDGLYKFFFSQMNCSKRIVSHTGSWSIKGEVLTIKMEEQRVIVGGKMVRAQGSCRTDSMLIDGYEKKVILTNPKISEIALSRIYPDIAENIHRPKIYIDAIPFWKFINDPAKIIREFEFR